MPSESSATWHSVVPLCRCGDADQWAPRSSLYAAKAWYGAGQEFLQILRMQTSSRPACGPFCSTIPESSELPSTPLEGGSATGWL